MKRGLSEENCLRRLIENCNKKKNNFPSCMRESSTISDNFEFICPPRRIQKCSWLRQLFSPTKVRFYKTQIDPVASSFLCYQIDFHARKLSTRQLKSYSESLSIGKNHKYSMARQIELNRSVPSGQPQNTLSCTLICCPLTMTILDSSLVPLVHLLFQSVKTSTDLKECPWISFFFGQMTSKSKKQLSSAWLGCLVS